MTSPLPNVLSPQAMATLQPSLPMAEASPWFKLSIAWCCCMTLLSSLASALELEKPLDGPFGGKARITLLDGSVLDGDVTAVANAQNGVASVLYRPEGDRRDGKRRIEAAEIQRLEVQKKKLGRVRPGRLSRRMGLPGGGFETPPSKRLKKIDEAFGTDSEEEYWNQVVPEQGVQRIFDAKTQDNGDVWLLPVLNLAFDSRIKVYRMPIRVLGSFFDMERQLYLVVKDEGKPIEVEKDNYKETFVELFGDCEVTAAYEKKERKFRHFAEHLFVYDRHCGAGEAIHDGS